MKANWKNHIMAPTSVPSGLPGRYYRPELDVLRCVAFLMVYLSHTIPVEAGSSHWLKAFSNASAFGVQVFFALSAFLITELLSREKSITGSVNARAFYARRILRIWPLYFFALGFGFLVSRLHSGWAIPVRGLAAYLLFVGNWYTGRHGYLPAGIGHLWTITVEEQFYLVWPMLVRYTTKRNLAIFCCIGWVCSQGALISLCRHHAPITPLVWTNSLVQLQYFALGAGVSLFLNQSTPKIGRNLRGLMIMCSVLVLFTADFVFGPQNGEGPSSVAQTYPEFLLVGVTVTVLLVGFLGLSLHDGLRSFRYLGKISYGLYVFHLPCLMVVSWIVFHLLKHDSPFAVLAIGLPVTIGIASISYRFFESPFLRVKDRLEIVKSRIV